MQKTLELDPGGRDGGAWGLCGEGRCRSDITLRYWGLHEYDHSSTTQHKTLRILAGEATDSATTTSFGFLFSIISLSPK